MDYYTKYQELVLNYNSYQSYLAMLNSGPVNVKMMELFFNINLYLDTQPNIPPLASINMSLPDGSILYNSGELVDINNIFNFFGAENYPIGRKFKEFCIFYKTRYDEGLIDTINDIKTAYSM